LLRRALASEKARAPENARFGSPTYFDCHDIVLAVRELQLRGVSFSGSPHLIAQMDDHDLWMAFFEDPDGYVLALMQEAPKGYKPSAA
jgi:methylmalonyl-CoA/ethylmalonyl-CoA epimerase